MAQDKNTKDKKGKGKRHKGNSFSQVTKGEGEEKSDLIFLALARKRDRYNMYLEATHILRNHGFQGNMDF
jgi:hypothetical protein